MSDLFNGILNFAGNALAANATNEAGKRAAKVQRETNAMQIDLANTAHQREVADLKKAGINPLQSAGGSGAPTVNLTAPTQEAEAGGRAGAQMGNAMANLMGTIIDLQRGQQAIELTKAQAAQTHANTENIKARTPWINPINTMHLQEGGQRIVESTQRTAESQARTQTIDAVRDPTVAKIIADTLNTRQRTATERHRTTTEAEIAKNAEELYGSKAREAKAIADQAAAYYKLYYFKQQDMKLTEQELSNRLLENKNFQLVIENILNNEYGKQLTWSKIFSGAFQSGAALSAPKTKVIPDYEQRRNNNK